MKALILAITIGLVVGCSPAENSGNGGGNNEFGDFTENPDFQMEELSADQLAGRGLKAEDFYIDNTVPENWHPLVAPGFTVATDSAFVMKSGLRGKSSSVHTVTEVSPAELKATESSQFRLSDGMIGSIVTKKVCQLIPELLKRKGNKKVSCEDIETTPNLPPDFNPDKYKNESCYVQNGNTISEDQKFALIPRNGSVLKAIVYRNRISGVIKCGDLELGQGEQTAFVILSKDIPDPYSFNNRSTGILYFHSNAFHNGASVSRFRTQSR